MDRSLEMSVFVSVVDAGSFVRAGEAMRMSKAAVSRYVDALEQRLGARLLHRTTRRLSLTEDGRLFYSRSKDILDAMDEAELEIGSRRAEPSGVIRVNVPVSFGIRHLAPIWGDFLAAHPKIDLDIDMNDRIVDLVEEGYDLAIRIGTLPDSSLVSRQLASTELFVCASPGYLKQYGTPQTPGDLAQHRVIAYSNFSSRDDWSFEGPRGSVSVRTRARVYSSNGETCRDIAIKDGGIILQPSFLIYEDLREGRLVRILPEYVSSQFGIHAVYATRKQVPMKVQALVAFLTDAFSKVDWNVDDARESQFGGE